LGSCAAILVRGWDHQTQFWKRTFQWLSYQSLVLIKQLVPDKKILWEFPIGSYVKSSFDPGERLQAPGSLWSDWLMLKNSSPMKLLGQIEPNLAGSIY
jgi:hypothetical protein